MQEFPIQPKEIVLSSWRNRSLISTLVRRDVAGRYKGSALGLLWSFFLPVLMLLIYTFIFSVVFKARWTAEEDSKTQFALVLFTGLMIFNLFAEVVNRAPALILSHANYVKKIVFPLEVLPVVAVGSALFHMLISLAVWTSFYVIFFGPPPVTVTLFPVVLLPLIMITLGAAWFLSAIGVYLRDVSQVTGVVVTAMMFLSPIFFPVTALPEQYQHLLLINPLTLAIEMGRDVLVWGRLPPLRSIIGYYLLGAVSAVAGFAWFQKTRKGFADVI